MEMLIVLVIAVLLFGKRLPEVGRSLGKGLVEFKKGLNDIQSEVHSATYAQPTTTHVANRYNADDHDEPTAPKFEPPTHEPTAASEPSTTEHTVSGQTADAHRNPESPA
jgi:sec-independent protein translocase protein TatA